MTLKGDVTTSDVRCSCASCFIVSQNYTAPTHQFVVRSVKRDEKTRNVNNRTDISYQKRHKSQFASPIGSSSIWAPSALIPHARRSDSRIIVASTSADAGRCKINWQPTPAAGKVSDHARVVMAIGPPFAEQSPARSVVFGSC